MTTIKRSRIAAVCCLLLAAISPLYADIFKFKADKMSGGRAAGNETTILEGNAQVQSDSIFIQADRIELQGKNNQFIHCTGKVTGRDSDKNIYFTTQDMRYDRDLKIARLQGDSSMEDRDNGIVAKARFIEYDQNNQTALLQIAVRLFKDTLVCRADYAVYNRKSKLLDLSGFPVVYKQDDEFSANRIRVNVDTEDVTMEGAVAGSIKGKATEDKKSGDKKKEDSKSQGGQDQEKKDNGQKSK